MTTPGSGWDVAGLDIQADLAVSVDSGAGTTATGRLSGSGHELRLVVDRPEVVIDAAGRRSSPAVAEWLAATGIRAELHGPRGRVAVLDPRLYSRVAKLVTGNPHISVDPSAWRVLARSTAVRSPAVVVTAALTAAAFWLLTRPTTHSE